MLARNFLQASDLSIEEDVHAALVKVLGMMERGELRHEPDPMMREPGKELTGHFNMACWNAADECGTVCCIGGTAEFLLGRTLNYNSSTELYYLFFPSLFWGVEYEKITVEQAALALRNYLTEGAARWDSVLKQ